MLGETGETVEPLVNLGWYLTPANECTAGWLFAASRAA